MNPDALPEEGQALRRLLGDAPVVTPDGLAVFGSWLVATLKAQDRPAEVGQKWARPLQIAERFGVKRAQVNAWLARLGEQGKVRRWQLETAKGTKGDTYYSLPDLEKAWSLDPLPAHESKK